MVQADNYQLTCQRYIELNPVRAAMAEEPAHYRSAIDDTRLARNQSQPLGNSRFLAKIEKATGVRRGRPRVLRVI